ncbi:acetyl-CoA carboxylase carboxyltransferase subunit alpha [Streptomyces sp. NPDC021562]|uniref:acetyl-CoA carboxylase carboxyltransferase subunit alpha n=1 Tax=Streptomyces sp. NPDC021562 TaxID=3155121 RepID=UPI00104CDA4F
MTTTAEPPVLLPVDEPKWARCRGCGRPAYLPRLRRDLGVCRECGHHGRLSAADRLDQLLDPGSFTPADTRHRSVDVLGFTDSRPYTDRLRAARERTGLDDAVLSGTGEIAGRPVLVAVMDFAFMGGSMGAAVGEAVTEAAERALDLRIPLLVVTASGGARMQEGAVSLMQMAKTSQAFARLRRHGVPSICLLTDPTYGGVTASFATLGDILVAESGAAIGFAGPEVIAKATGKRLPEGFQRAEHLLEHGMLDRVEPRAGLRGLLGRLLALLAGDPPTDDAPAASADAQPLTDPGALTARPAWDTVRTARDPRRPTTLDHIGMVADDFVELHGDRLYADDPSVVGGLAAVGGRTVMLIGHQKGHDTQELVRRNFGMPQPEGYRKALRLMRLADRLGIPVVTLVDTQGAFPGLGAEERGQAWAIAESILGMAELTVPVVSVILGEGGSGGALALAVADRVLMLENACYSVISPESCSTILFGDPSHAARVAEALRLTAPELLRLGVVDAVLPEPPGGAQAAPAVMAATLRHAIVRALDGPPADRPGEPARSRYERFRRLGTASARTGGHDD